MSHSPSARHTQIGTKPEQKSEHNMGVHKAQFTNCGQFTKKPEPEAGMHAVYLIQRRITLYKLSCRGGYLDDLVQVVDNTHKQPLKLLGVLDLDK